MKKLLIAILLITSVSQAQLAVPAEVQKISNQFNQTMMMCPERVWPGFSWKNLQVVFTYPSQNQSWIWDADTNKSSPVLNKELSSSALGSLYSFFNFNNKNAMSLNMEIEFGDLFDLGTHEFFHSQGQKNWKRLQGDRETVYPMVSTPRFYRRMIYLNLEQYFEFGERKNLNQARFWYDKWSKEYPGEMLSTTDGYEGTAKYVEDISAAVSAKGCGVTESEIYVEVLNRVKAHYANYTNEYVLKLDTEGYALGSIAALIIRFKHNNQPQNGMKSVANAQTPLQILLEPVSPETEILDGTIESAFFNATKVKNLEMSNYLEPVIQNWSRKEYVRVAAPFQWLQSNLRPIVFAKSSVLQKGMMALAAEHVLQSSNKLSKITLAQGAVTVSDDQAPCTGVNDYALVHKDEITPKGLTFHIQSKTINGVLIGTTSVDAQGYSYICPDLE